MKREIRFRAWDTVERKMWNAANFPDQYLIDLSGDVWDTKDQSNRQFGIVGAVVRDKFTLMQYTGSNDRSGRGVYEGDLRIAQSQGGAYLQVIEFHNTSETCGRGWIGRNIGVIDLVMWNTEREIIITKRIDTFSYHEILNIGDVVGNIYENPELLK